MTVLREHLAEQLAKKVQAHGLVVWEDDAGEYSDVAASLVPPDVRFEAFDGSWYELRRRIEDAVAGESPPRLIVHVPAAPPDDPLAEVRASGAEFKRKLATLLKQALVGQLTETRIAKIAQQALTLQQAEAALDAGDEADVRLVALLGSADVTRMLATVLLGDADAALDHARAWPAVTQLARDAVGAEISGSGGVLRDEMFRHLLLTELAQATGGLPEELASAWAPPAASQRRRAVEVLDRLRATPGAQVVYSELARRADEALSLTENLAWSDGLPGAPGTPAVDQAAFAEALSRLGAGDHNSARAIATQRLTVSPWVSDPTADWGARWRAVHAITALRTELATVALPQGGTAELLTGYETSGWRVDRAHRRLELTRTELRGFGPLEDALTSARAAYDDWLDRLLQRFTAAVVDGNLEIGGLLRQGEIHNRFVAGADSQRVAYVWVDALRYELGVDLAEALRTIAGQENVELHAAVAAVPTITPVGMANLLPDAAASLRVALDERSRIAVSVGATHVAGVPERRDLLRARHGAVADLDLNTAAQKGEKALRNAIGDAAVILIRSQEIDDRGESGMLAVGWSDFDNVIAVLTNTIARLAQAGVNRVVISADHGFIALGQELGPQRLVDPPAGAAGILKRRVFIGRGGAPSPATVRIPLAACGVVSDLEVTVPRGLAVFRAGGARQFFHGGLSPQELLVPVIVANLTPAPEPQKLQFSVSIAGGRITTGIFAATVGFQGDLFTDQFTVRVIVTREHAAQPVARVVSGPGYDPETGAVTVAAAKPAMLSFQITANLDVGNEVDLQVLDARTGKRMVVIAVPVAAPVRVEDELD